MTRHPSTHFFSSCSSSSLSHPRPSSPSVPPTQSHKPIALNALHSSSISRPTASFSALASRSFAAFPSLHPGFKSTHDLRIKQARTRSGPSLCRCQVMRLQPCENVRSLAADVAGMASRATKPILSPTAPSKASVVDPLPPLLPPTPPFRPLLLAPPDPVSPLPRPAPPPPVPSRILLAATAFSLYGGTFARTSSRICAAATCCEPLPSSPISK
ncbi:unnamed protein product [Closterium sp. NIES-54]